MKFNKPVRLLREYYIEVIIGLIVLGYCIVRAYGLSMTHDESATILDYVPLSLIDILTNTPPSANNHILNTLLVKALISIHNSPFVIRLPSLFALLLYLFYAFRLSHEMLDSKLSHILGFTILILNPYVLDFFSLARGYGLSLGFLMGSLYYLYRFVSDTNNKYLTYSIGFAILGVWSNLTMLHYYLAMVALISLMLLVGKQKLKPVIKSLGPGTSILILLIYSSVTGLIKENELYFGGQSGFYQDTVHSLVSNSLYGARYFGEHTIDIIQWVFLGLSLSAILWGAFQFYRQRHFSGSLLWCSLLVIMIAGNILQFYLFNTRYLIHRTALIYWPVFCLLWIGLMGMDIPDKWKRIKSVQWFVTGLRSIIVIGLAFHFYQSMNFIRVREWWYDRHTKSMLEYVVRHNPEQDTLKLGAKWIFKPTINYYIRARNYGFIKGPGQGRGGIDTTDYYDYYYIEPSDKDKINPIYELDTMMGSGNWLMKKPQ